MKYLVRLSALVVMAAMMAFAALSPAVAQTPTSDPAAELDKIASDVTIYGRSYEGDMAAMTASPEADAAMPVMAIIQAYDLMDADTAEQAFPYVEQMMKDELEPTIGAELVTEEVDDLGDTATLSTAEVDQGGTTATIALLMVQQDEVVYLSASVAMNGPADGTANDFMMFMLDGEPGDVDAVEFEDDGTSTGGYFDVFPTDEDADVVQDLMVTEDMYQTTQ